MQKIILSLDKYKQYEPIINEGDTIWILECFLHDIGNSSTSYCIKWALDPTQISLGKTNSTETNKKSDVIIINYIFSEESDGGPFFTTSIPEFVKTLTEWERLVKNSVPKIIITEQNGIISIEGK